MTTVIDRTNTKCFIKWPQTTFASKIEVKDNTLEVTREYEGLETIEINIPAIVTCDLD